jgi:hypothetical protein
MALIESNVCIYCGQSKPKCEGLLGPATCSMLVAYLDRQMAWSLTTFGGGTRTKGLTAHIRKELAEIEAAPHDLEEWIDVVEWHETKTPNGRISQAENLK